MALTCSWRGFADTDLDFAEFFNADHTVVARFMPQYPHAYLGPILSVNGTGIYMIGQGAYQNPPASQTKLALQVGSAQQNYPLSLTAGNWYHLAVVRSGANLTLYLNAQAAAPAVSVSGPTPAGKVRIGKDTFNPSLDAGGAQFYGFVDDVGVFTTALSASAIASLAAAPRLTGSEQGLLAGYVFGYVPTGGLPRRLARPLTLSAGATLRGGLKHPRRSGRQAAVAGWRRHPDAPALSSGSVAFRDPGL